MEDGFDVVTRSFPAMTALQTGGVPAPGSIRWARYLGICLCAIAFFFGAVALAGWVFHRPHWRSFLAGGSEMKANAALCLLGLATAIALRRFASNGKVARLIANALALVVGIIALLTFAEYLFHADLRLDEAIFNDRSTIGTS